MPYHINGKCVVKGTKENPGNNVKCHETVAKAKAHLRALYANVEDAVLKEFDIGQSSVGDMLESKVHAAFTLCADLLYGMGYMERDERIELSGAIGDSLGNLSKAVDKLNLRQRHVSPEVANAVMGIFRGGGKPGSLFTAYKDIATGQDRWIAVSTAEMWDKQDEMFTKEAMDYDITYTLKSGDWPELRMYHVRAFKLGGCDARERIDMWGVDKGYWHDTPFAQAVKDLAQNNKGRWRTSRGFFPVRAVGLCPNCDANLSVDPVNFIFGVRCNVCKSYYPKVGLKQLRHLQARTYDITVTDVPVLPVASIAAYSVEKSK